MPDPRPLHVVGPAGPLRDRVLARLGPPTRVADRVSELVDDAEVPPGIVLLLADVLPPGDVLAALEVFGRGEGEWTVCVVREEGEGVEVRAVSLGWRHGLDSVSALQNGDEDSLLELRRIVKRIARARHDVNNPLTSGMAETQLLLMDVEDPEIREALGTIQTQLRRIRDLVAATGGVRPGKD